MKQILLILLFVSSFLPAQAWDHTVLERKIIARTIDVKYYNVYAHSREENARRAVRQGYKNFRIHLGNDTLTSNDQAILTFVHQELIPFADNLQIQFDAGNLEDSNILEQTQTELAELAKKLKTLLYKNQHSYTNSALIDDNTALEEAFLILQEALINGKF